MLDHGWGTTSGKGSPILDRRGRKPQRPRGTGNICGLSPAKKCPETDGTDGAALLGSYPAIERTMLLAAAGLAHDLHDDLMEIGAGGVQGVDAAHEGRPQLEEVLMRGILGGPH